MDNEFNSLPKPSQTTIEEVVIKERLRQAKLSFNIALSLTAISAIISVTGVGLLLSGKTIEGITTTAGGLASKILSVSLLKKTQDTNERLAQTATQKLSSEQHLLLKKTQDTNERLAQTATQKLSSEQHPLKGKVIDYDAPYEPVALEDWEALK